MNASHGLLSQTDAGISCARRNRAVEAGVGLRRIVEQHLAAEGNASAVDDLSQAAIQQISSSFCNVASGTTTRIRSLSLISANGSFALIRVSATTGNATLPFSGAQEADASSAECHASLLPLVGYLPGLSVGSVANILSAGTSVAFLPTRSPASMQAPIDTEAATQFELFAGIAGRELKAGEPATTLAGMIVVEATFAEALDDLTSELDQARSTSFVVQARARQGEYVLMTDEAGVPIGPGVPASAKSTAEGASGAIASLVRAVWQAHDKASRPIPDPIVEPLVVTNAIGVDDPGLGLAFGATGLQWSPSPQNGFTIVLVGPVRDGSLYAVFTAGAVILGLTMAVAASALRVSSMDAARSQLVIEEDQARSNSRTTFLRGVFHDVRVPAQGVVLGLSMLLSEVAEAEQASGDKARTDSERKFRQTRPQADSENASAIQSASHRKVLPPLGENFSASQRRNLVWSPLALAAQDSRGTAAGSSAVAEGKSTASEPINAMTPPSSSLDIRSLRNLLQSMKASTDDMVGILNQVLDMDKLESGELTISPTWFCLQQRLKASLSGLLGLSQPRSLHLSFHFDAHVVVQSKRQSAVKREGGNDAARRTKRTHPLGVQVLPFDSSIRPHEQSAEKQRHEASSPPTTVIDSPSPGRRRKNAAGMASRFRHAAIALPFGTAYAIPMSICEVHADPDKLHQATANLLSNAARYSPIGGTICLTAQLFTNSPFVLMEEERVPVESFRPNGGSPTVCHASEGGSAAKALRKRTDGKEISSSRVSACRQGEAAVEASTGEQRWPRGPVDAHQSLPPPQQLRPRAAVDATRAGQVRGVIHSGTSTATATATAAHSQQVPRVTSGREQRDLLQQAPSRPQHEQHRTSPRGQTLQPAEARPRFAKLFIRSVSNGPTTTPHTTGSLSPQNSGGLGVDRTGSGSITTSRRGSFAQGMARAHVQPSSDSTNSVASGSPPPSPHPIHERVMAVHVGAELPGSLVTKPPNAEARTDPEALLALKGGHPLPQLQEVHAFGAGSRPSQSPLGDDLASHAQLQPHTDASKQMADTSNSGSLGDEPLRITASSFDGSTPQAALAVGFSSTILGHDNLFGQAGELASISTTAAALHRTGSGPGTSVQNKLVQDDVDAPSATSAVTAATRLGLGTASRTSASGDAPASGPESPGFRVATHALDQSAHEKTFAISQSMAMAGIAPPLHRQRMRGLFPGSTASRGSSMRAAKSVGTGLAAKDAKAAQHGRQGDEMSGCCCSAVPSRANRAAGVTPGWKTMRGGSIIPIRSGPARNAVARRALSFPSRPGIAGCLTSWMTRSTDGLPVDQAVLTKEQDVEPSVADVAVPLAGAPLPSNATTGDTWASGIGAPTTASVAHARESSDPGLLCVAPLTENHGVPESWAEAGSSLHHRPVDRMQASTLSRRSSQANGCSSRLSVACCQPWCGLAPVPVCCTRRRSGDLGRAGKGSPSAASLSLPAVLHSTVRASQPIGHNESLPLPGYAKPLPAIAEPDHFASSAAVESIFLCEGLRDLANACRLLNELRGGGDDDGGGGGRRSSPTQTRGRDVVAQATAIRSDATCSHRPESTQSMVPVGELCPNAERRRSAMAALTRAVWASRRRHVDQAVEWALATMECAGQTSKESLSQGYLLFQTMMGFGQIGSTAHAAIKREDGCIRTLASAIAGEFDGMLWKAAVANEASVDESTRARLFEVVPEAQTAAWAPASVAGSKASAFLKAHQDAACADAAEEHDISRMGDADVTSVLSGGFPSPEATAVAAECRRVASVLKPPTQCDAASSNIVSSELLIGQKQWAVGDAVIVITVSDAGPGIAHAKQAAIFSPFKQLARGDTRYGDGSGLGLSIAKSIIGLHGGHIGLHSRRIDSPSTSPASSQRGWTRNQEVAATRQRPMKRRSAPHRIASEGADSASMQRDHRSSDSRPETAARPSTPTTPLARTAATELSTRRSDASRGPAAFAATRKGRSSTNFGAGARAKSQPSVWAAHTSEAPHMSDIDARASVGISSSNSTRRPAVDSLRCGSQQWALVRSGRKPRMLSGMVRHSAVSKGGASSSQFAVDLTSRASTAQTGVHGAGARNSTSSLVPFIPRLPAFRDGTAIASDATQRGTTMFSVLRVRFRVPIALLAAARRRGLIDHSLLSAGGACILPGQQGDRILHALDTADTVAAGLRRERRNQESTLKEGSRATADNPLLPPLTDGGHSRSLLLAEGEPVLPLSLSGRSGMAAVGGATAVSSGGPVRVPSWVGEPMHRMPQSDGAPYNAGAGANDAKPGSGVAEAPPVLSLLASDKQTTLAAVAEGPTLKPSRDSRKGARRVTKEERNARREARNAAREASKRAGLSDGKPVVLLADTTESIRFPKPSTTVAESASSEAVASRELEPALFAVRSLVVDDTPSNLQMLQLLLQRMGVETASAEDGAEAVRAVAAAQQAGESSGDPWSGLELITMDYSMPKMSGPEATRRIRDMGFKGLILGCTGNALAQDIQVFEHAGVDRVLSKPIDAATLLQVLVDRFGDRIIRPAGI